MLLGTPELEGAGGTILLPDPVTFPTRRGCSPSSRRTPPGVPILGGVASAWAEEGRHGALPRRRGARATVRSASGFDGVELLPLVSQGARADRSRADDQRPPTGRSSRSSRVATR